MWSSSSTQRARSRGYRGWRACCLGAALGLVLVAASGRRAEGVQGELPRIEKKTENMKRMEGFFDLYWDEATGKIYWEIDRWDTEFLYQVSLSTGLGSNPVGLDRGQLGGTYILVARRVGPTVLLVEPNYKFRARSDYRDEVRAVTEAFAPSTHWGFEVEAQTDDRAEYRGRRSDERERHCQPEIGHAGPQQPWTGRKRASERDHQSGAAYEVQVKRKESADDRHEEDAAPEARDHRDDAEKERHDEEQHRPHPPWDCRERGTARVRRQRGVCEQRQRRDTGDREEGLAEHVFLGRAASSNSRS